MKSIQHTHTHTYTHARTQTKKKVETSLSVSATTLYENSIFLVASLRSATSKDSVKKNKKIAPDSKILATPLGAIHMRNPKRQECIPCQGGIQKELKILGGEDPTVGADSVSGKARYCDRDVTVKISQIKATCIQHSSGYSKGRVAI